MSLSKSKLFLIIGFLALISVYVAKSDPLDSINQQAINLLQKQKKFHGSRDFINLIKTLKITNRKEVCFTIMNQLQKSDPVSAFTAANCLIYNGFGKSAIPFLTDFSFNGNNEKYLHGRMGYGWLHSGDWYEVGKEALSKMTNGDDLFTWIQQEIRNETLAHPKLYGPKAISSTIKQLLRLELKNKPLTPIQKEIQKNCKSPIINLSGYSCKFDKKTMQLVDCFIKDVSGLELIGCGE